MDNVTSEQITNIHCDFYELESLLFSLRTGLEDELLSDNDTCCIYEVLKEFISEHFKNLTEHASTIPDLSLFKGYLCLFFSSERLINSMKINIINNFLIFIKRISLQISEKL